MGQLDHQPLVSIVTNFYNAERFIAETIESVITQTYSHWELLLVDDGSVDSSTQIALAYAKANSKRIRYFEHDGHANKGMSASRNLGIQQSKGEYLAFLDADDIWLPEKLHKQVTLLEANPEAGMLYGKTLYWFSWTKRPKDEKRDFIPVPGVETDQLHLPPSLVAMFLEGTAAVPCPCSLLVRRTTALLIDGFNDSFLNLYEDQVFYAKICLHENVFVSSECLDYYRQHPDSSMAIAQRTHTEKLARAIFLKWFLDYLYTENLAYPELTEIAYKELWKVSYPSWLPKASWISKGYFWSKKWIARVATHTLPKSLQARIWFPGNHK
jgi:glycosyltransferase involved in cell wall biosynthesis